MKFQVFVDLSQHESGPDFRSDDLEAAIKYATESFGKTGIRAWVLDEAQDVWAFADKDGVERFNC